MKAQPKNKVVEYKTLSKYFGSEFMMIMFQGFAGYEEIRKKHSYQQIFDELKDY